MIGNLLLKIRNRNLVYLAFVGVFLFITIMHAYNILKVPDGLYTDEISIGLNAATIADKGVDEFDIKSPTYFKAFGEYKNPVYIYTTAILFKVFGISDYVLRYTSVFYYLIGLLGSCLLVIKLFKSWSVRFFFLLSLGFIPAYFTLSRIAFEAISQFGVFSWILYLCFIVFEQGSTSKLKQWFYPPLLGLLIALSIYTYSTARLLTLGFVLILLILYLRRNTLIKFIIMGATTVIGLLPYLSFSLENPTALTERFSTLSYLTHSNLSLIEKVSMFVQNYFSYWGLPFLVLNGDINLKHSVGFGGAIFIAILLAAIIGIILIGYSIWKRKDPITGSSKRSYKFATLILLNLLISPVAAALTTDGPHLIRSLLLGFFISLVACYGINYLTKRRQDIKRLSYAKLVSLISLFILLFIEIFFYTSFYFNKYPAITIEAFGSAGIQEAIEYSISQKPIRILLSNRARHSKVITSYYSYVVENPQNIPITPDLDSKYINRKATMVDDEEKVCYIYLQPEKYEISDSSKYSLFQRGLTSVACRK